MAERYQLTLSMPNVDQEMMAGAFHSQCTDLKYADCIKSVSFMRTEETSCATHQLLTNTELGSGFQARFSALSLTCITGLEKSFVSTEERRWSLHVFCCLQYHLRFYCALFAVR